MIHEKPVEIYCYQLNSILKGKPKNKQKGTQNVPNYMNEAVSPLSYELKSRDMATKTEQDIPVVVPIKKGKAKNICKCKLKKPNEAYNLKYQTNHNIASTINEINNDNSASKKKNKNLFSLFSKRKGMYHVNPKKKSLISLYRKRNKETVEIKDVNNNTMNSKKLNNRNTQEQKGTTINNMKYKKNKKSNIGKNEKLNTDPKKSRRVNFELKDDACPEGVCRINIDKSKQHHCKCDKTKVNIKSKTDKRNRSSQNTQPITSCTEDICKTESSKNKRDTDTNFFPKIGAGDQIIKSKKKCNNVISGLFKHNRRYIETKTPLEPVLAIRVDSSNLQVLNSAEIKRKVKAMGKVEKNDMTCICPSRLEKEKQYGLGDTCEAGICEIAGKDKYSRFNCKCAKKTILECCDTTCDRPLKKSTKLETTKNYNTSSKTNKPLFQMVLDNNHMNILNTGEIEDVIRTASYTNICPTGICNDSARNKRAILNCKCINKKISPASHECDERTCRPKKSLFYIICSRIFSGSNNGIYSHNNWHRSYYANRRGALELGPKIGQRRPNNRNRGPLARGDGLQRNLQYNNNVQCMCNCECDEKSDIKESKRKPIKPKMFAGTRLTMKTKAKRSGFFQNKSMAKKFHQREKHFSKIKNKRAKEERRKEREEEKKRLKLKREIDKLAMKEADDSNFLANFFNGILNLTMKTVQQLFKVVISIIFDPINSYLYAKDKVTNPMESAKSFQRWLKNTWKSKESKFSKTITDSHAINVLADHLEESVIFQTFTNKGRTKLERQVYERKVKLRKRRMRKRHDQALYGCRHMLLTTLRKQPCLWVYHICPEFYPQCLSLLTFCGNFFHIIMYLGALLCWTPCIMMMELVRACLCCIVCTQ